MRGEMVRRREVGPASYQPLRYDLSRYAGPPARAPFGQPPARTGLSAQQRKGNTRHPSTAARLTNLTPPNEYPGPGAYAHERYSPFSSQSMSERCQTNYSRLRTDRSSIRSVYDCGRICIASDNPGPSEYAPVPPLDRLRMSMRKPPCPGTGRITPFKGRTLSALLHSPANLSPTLAMTASR